MPQIQGLTQSEDRGRRVWKNKTSLWDTFIAHNPVEVKKNIDCSHFSQQNRTRNTEFFFLKKA
ncbi:hypothetical protein [Xanthocytophaga flava]|uniref:hypothetical protein n=1 Tax=Xanthocytophaga flava TaxID=3048013 RepID=UPI0028D2CCA4|nr:hypothetical protein [Xanthocytophaga flavus]MDJ1466680.1 hypothetical protein [Xanthocytophaga flavus]